MSNIETKFESNGFVVVNNILNKEELYLLSKKCDAEVNTEVGTRNLLEKDWAIELAQKLIISKSLKPLMPNNAVAVQCNYFVKDTEKNWSVSLHRDLSIPIKKKISSKEWKGWSLKEGILYAQPPEKVLAQMVAIRLHLEDNNADNGALEFVAGSHKNLNLNDERDLCLVAQGGALIMSPLVLHASTKLRLGKRRVLHFVFGPEKLPNNAEWANAI